MRTAAAWMLGSWLVACPLAAHASDFWDEVRTPGLHAFRQALAAASAARVEGKAQAALELSEIAVAKLPRDARGHLAHGQALWMLQRIEGAGAAFEQAFTIEPTVFDREPVHAAVHAAVLSGRLHLAEKLLDRALAQLAPSLARATLHVVRGDVQLALGATRLHEAQVNYRQALRDAPTLVLRVSISLALCLDRLGEASASSQLLTQFATLDSVLAELGRWPLANVERAVRTALWLDHAGEFATAAPQWRGAVEARGPWQEYAAAKLAARARFQGATK